jgi:hypothetical protein
VAPERPRPAADSVSRHFPKRDAVSKKKKAILLRIPDELSEALQRWAYDDLRSLNAQIEYLLREAVRTRRRERLEEAPGEAGEGDQRDSDQGDEGA